MKIKNIIFLILFLIFLSAEAFAAASSEPTMQTAGKEIKMGVKLAKEVEMEIPRVVDPALEKRLANIAERLSVYMQRDLRYEVRVLKMDQMNAFALPGGYTYITTGMLKKLKTDDEIAAVLAHEFVHADRAHALVQAARKSKLNLITLAGIIAAAQGAGPGAAIMAGAMQTAMVNSYTIDLEKEADARGIMALYKAHYDPTAMLIVMEYLRIETMKRRSYNDLGIYQTHPEEEERIEAAVKFMNDNHIPVQRKHLLKNLVVEINRNNDKLYMNIDETNIMILPANAENDSFLKNFKNRLDRYLELEVAPYDFYVINSKEGKALIIRGNILLTSNELPQGAPSVQTIRDTINNHLVKVRAHSPLTDFFQ